MARKRPRPARTLLYDHGGHNFTYELASELAARGVGLAYAFTEGVTAPHGRLTSREDFEVIALGRGRRFERYRLAKRVAAELRLGFEVAATARRTRSRHVITCNMPVIIAAITALYCTLTRRRLTIWFQDSQAGIAAAMVHSGFALRALRALEAWGLRRADCVVAISPAMVEETQRMKVPSARVHLLPNWAPVEKIPVVGKVNPWSVANDLATTFVFLYSGTLGLKHSPARLSSLARWIKDDGLAATVVVVSEGQVAENLANEANAYGLPLRIFPFQSAENLPYLLGAADVCVVLLEAHASEFSVPSKVWSYMCASRPILGSMPAENEASRIVGSEAVCGFVVEPTAPDSDFLSHARTLCDDPALRNELGARGRQFAEQRFSPENTILRFAELVGLSAEFEPTDPTAAADVDS